MLRGISRYSHVHGPWSIYRVPFSTVTPRPRRESELTLLRKWGADGIITRDRKNIAELEKVGIPLIAVDDGNIAAGVPNVISNSEAIGELAAKYYVNKGYKSFAFCGYSNMSWSNQRRDSFRRAVENSGYRVNVYQQPEDEERRLWENELSEISEWLKTLRRPTAILTCSDDRSQQVVEATKMTGIHVPEEISILGVDNDELLCELSDPQLSSIEIDTEHAGYEAAKLLDRMMKGKDYANVSIVANPSIVVTRHSTDILAIDDREVVRAVRFIRENASSMIQVPDVVDVTSVSRRTLEQKFRRVLGRSILDEIRRVHVERLAEMLVKSTMSVKQLAISLGYPSVDNIGRYFRRHMGMNPGEYRKKYGRQ